MKRKTRTAFLSTFVILACAVSLLASDSARIKKPRQNRVPSIANVLGIKVGKGTIEALEKKLGPGAHCTGGHPHGGRAWYLSEQRVWVYADGFDYTRTGRIVDHVLLGASKADMQYSFFNESSQPFIPKVRTGIKSIGWLGHVSPGMTKQQVLKLTRGLPKPKIEGGKLIWSMPGAYRYEGAEEFVWKSELTFKNDVLTEIDVYIDSLLHSID